MSDLVERLRERATSYRAGGPSSEHTAVMLDEAADEIERLRAALDTVRASGLLIGSTTLHNRVRSAVYNAIDANPAAMKDAPHDR